MYLSLSILTMSSMIFVSSEIYDLFFHQGGGGLPNAQCAVWQFDDPVVFWL